MNKFTRPGIATEVDQGSRSNLGLAGGPGYAGTDGVKESTRCSLQEHAREVSDSALLTYLRRATEEAASLARATDYPLLVLPELFAEKAAEAFLQLEREIRQRSQGLVALAG